MYDPLGDRHKSYEKRTEIDLLPGIPVIARIDGRNFHAFTRGMCRPYDVRFMEAMNQTMLYLVGHTSAVCGYVQSDEITLVWLQRSYGSSIWFDGRHSKMVSQLAAQASMKFMTLAQATMPMHMASYMGFDARVWQVPTQMEAVNALIWRERDSVRNSLLMSAQCHYPHAELQGKDQDELHELLHKKGINWAKYPTRFKRGLYGKPVMRPTQPFLHADLGELPPLHAARKNPALIVQRRSVELQEWPILSTIKKPTEQVFSTP